MAAHLGGVFCARASHWWRVFRREGKLFGKQGDWLRRRRVGSSPASLSRYFAILGS